MGKITDALKKAAEERLARLEKRAEDTYAVNVRPRATADLRIDPHVVLYSDPRSPITEQYKILRTNLQSLSTGPKAMKTFVVTSAIHGEGKTITCINLAMALSTDTAKKSVVLVDADMRKSRIAKYLGADVQIGLSEYLSGKTDLENVLLGTGIENLSFIPAGNVPDNPAELLGSAKMKELIGILKAKFDFVIFDTPPIIPVTDPVVIGSQVDGIIMAVQAGRTQRGVIKHAVNLINQARGKLLGHVMTNVEYHIPEYIYRYL